MRILISTLTRQFCHVMKESLEAISKLETPCATDWIILTEQAYGDGDKTIGWKLNKARDIALKGFYDFHLNDFYDFLLNVEDDIVPPPHALLELLKTSGDVCLGIYPERKSKVGNTDWLVVQEWNKNPEAKQAITEMRDFEIKGSGGMGCILISRRVLEKVEFPECLGFDHYWFSLLRHKNFKVVATPRVQCKHLERT